MSRLTPLKVESLSGRQREVFEAVTGGKRSINRPLSEFLTPEPAKAVLGEAGLVELSVLLGFYGLVSLLLNSFDVSLPDGAVTPFDSH